MLRPGPLCFRGYPLGVPQSLDTLLTAVALGAALVGVVPIGGIALLYAVWLTARRL